MSSYWQRRQRAEDEKAAFAQAQEVISRIEQLHRDAQKRIIARQERIRARFRRAYGLDKDKASELLSSPVGREEYLKLLEEIDRLGKNNPKREELLAKAAAPAYAYRAKLADAMELENDAITAHMAQREQEILREHLVKTAQEQSLRAGYRIQHTAGVGFRFTGVSEELANVMVQRPWSGLSFSARIWKSQSALEDWLNTQLSAGLYTGESGETLAAELAEGMGVSLNRARTLVRTETTHVCNQADLEAYEECGIETYIYDATLDARTSKICRKLDRKRFKRVDAQVGVNFPPMHPNCRSTTITGDLTDEKLSRMKRWSRDPVTGEQVKVPANMSYEEWRKMQAETYGEERVALGEKMARNRGRDKKQLAQYQSVLGKKHMPKDLASFQQMKYTEPDEWAKTKRAYATIGEIDGKTAWNDTFKRKAKNVYWTMRGNDVEMSSHGIARYLDRRDDVKGGCTMEQLAQICAKPVNYVQSDGREVRYYDGAAVIFSADTGEVVSFIDRNTAKKDWRAVE